MYKCLIEMIDSKMWHCTLACINALHISRLAELKCSIMGTS